MYDLAKNRVYTIFSGVEKNFNENALQRADGTQLPATWAGNYKLWISQYLDEIAEPVWSWASSTLAASEDQTNNHNAIESATKQARSKKMDGIKSHPHFTESYFKADFGLT